MDNSQKQVKPQSFPENHGQSPSMVTVSLKNEVSEHKIEFTGDYQISETVNGKPSWKSGENAIWCNPNGNWMIGYWNKLGENDGEFWLPQNNYEGLTDNRNVWKYSMDDSTWITPSDSNDVIISSSEDNFGHEGSFVNHVSTLGCSVGENPDDGQTIIRMPQESLNATNVANGFNGLEALSKMQSLKFREPKFENQALMEIGEKGDPGYEYYVVEDISQNSMLIYSKLEHIETLKIVQDVSKKYVTVYASTFYLGVAEIESTALCKGGAARQVNISNKNGALVCTLTMSYYNVIEYEITGINGNLLGKLKLKEEKGYINWNENEIIDAEFKALMLGSAFLIMRSYGNYNIIIAICSLLLFVLGIFMFIFKFQTSED